MMCMGHFVVRSKGLVGQINGSEGRKEKSRKINE